jgi:alpha-1,6-mannosyltransferase
LKKLTSFIFAISIFTIAYLLQRHEFATLFAAYAVSFAAYLWALKLTKTEADLNFFLILAVILRGPLLFSFPNLSDDIYRFIWDGRLIALGENPFSHLPTYYIDNQLFTDVLTPELFSKLNSPNYFSVYPSVCQGVFFIAVSLFPKSIIGATIVIKSFLFACEIGTLYLLKKLAISNNSKSQTSDLQTSNFKFQTPLIYALNPLILIELVGNVHFEAAMIFFFLLSIFLLKELKFNLKNRLKINDYLELKTCLKLGLAATAWSLSISAKLLTIMLLPLVWRQLGWRKSIVFWLFVLLTSLLLFIPIYNDLFIPNILTSIKLYSNKFEFNASVFYVIQGFFYWKTGWNKIEFITPYLTGFVVLFILKTAFLKNLKLSDLPNFKNLLNLKTKQKTFDIGDFFESCLFVLMVYFACATTVHPWYAAMPLACSVFTKWRFPMVWTFTIFLTYHGYTEGSSKHTENFGLVAFEYLAVLGWFLYEVMPKPNRSKIRFSE